MRRVIPVVLLILAMGTLAVAQQPRRLAIAPADRSQAMQAVDDASAQLTELEKIHARTVAINSNLCKLYEALSKKAAEVGKLAEAVRASKGTPRAAAGSSSAQDQLLNAAKQIQETQMSFNLQYLQLQSQMQNENRAYTAVSNIMKTKHDTVKNSISNMR
jgi:hypothetical protein